MKIKVNPEAVKNYIARNTIRGGVFVGNMEWVKKHLGPVQGEWLEVETKWLFKDQFNTAPIKGVSESGLRLMADDICEIEDDARPGRIFDEFTHENYLENEIPEHCKTGERKKYLKRFAKYDDSRINPARLKLLPIE